MIRKRTLGSAAAIGGIGAAIAFLAGPPATRADELADLRANQELLQQRIDQLSQAPVGAVPIPGQYVPGYGPPSGPTGPGQPVVSGSFPRSFLIPGTDTSIRIGGFANATVQWYATGANQGGQLNGQGGTNNQTFFDGPGGTGNLPNIPLNNSIAHSRGSAFDISPRLSRLLFDTRTPTAWGEIKTYIELDFAYNNTNTAASNLVGVSSGWLPRLRKAYGTMGGFEAGQDTGILHDPDADPELIDSTATSAGRAREPQVMYTYAGPYGTVYRIGAENPVPTMDSFAGKNDLDTNQVPNTAACSVTGNTTSNLPPNTACLGTFSFFSPLQSSMPEWIGTARINQPWGHLQIGGAVRENNLNDGEYLHQQFLGYAGTISGDAHPFSGVPGPLGKDDLGFGLAAGPGAGGQIANGGGVVTNFGSTLFVPGVGYVNPAAATAGTACTGGAVATASGCPTGTTSATAAWNSRDAAQSLSGFPNSGGFINGVNVRSAYDRLVRTQNIGNYGGWIWYQHWWNDELRSTIEASGLWSGVNTSLLPPGTTNNKLLGMGHANLFWSPVAFVDFGVEYAYGHRVTVANFKGDSNTLLGEFRVRF
jgi:Porin subfamily/DcaP outer membrane protein